MHRVSNKSHHISRPFIIAIVIIVALAGGALTWRNHTTKSISDVKKANTATQKSTTKPANTVTYSPATSSDNNSSEERKNNPSSAASTLDNGPTTSSSKQEVSITITRAGKDQSGTNLQVATLISGAQSGTCTISVSKSGKATITREVAIELQANSYVCPVVSIPLTSIPEKGNWNVSATVQSNGQTKSTNWAANPVIL